MKRLNLKTINGILALALLIGGPSAFAAESVKWTGVVQERSGHHTPSHDMKHELELVKEDGERINIVDSPSLMNLHKEKDRNLVVELSGELTSQFLFWGGNLVVKDFKVLEEGDEIAHYEIQRPRTIDREIGSGRR